MISASQALALVPTRAAMRDRYLNSIETEIRKTADIGLTSIEIEAIPSPLGAEILGVLNDLGYRIKFLHDCQSWHIDWSRPKNINDKLKPIK